MLGRGRIHAAAMLGRGQAFHVCLNVAAAGLGVVLIAAGSVAVSSKAPATTCGPDARHLVSVDPADAGSANSTLLSLGVPLVVAGLVVVAWGGWGFVDGYRARSGAALSATPFLKGSAIWFIVAALCVWTSAFISVAAASVLRDMCDDFHCGVQWSPDGQAGAADLRCIAVHEAWMQSCADAGVCCSCRSSWSARDHAAFMCRDTWTWACAHRDKKDAAQAALVVAACILSAAAATCAWWRRCIRCPGCVMDVSGVPLPPKGSSRCGDTPLESPLPSLVDEPISVDCKKPQDDEAVQEADACDDRPESEAIPSEAAGVEVPKTSQEDGFGSVETKSI